MLIDINFTEEAGKYWASEEFREDIIVNTDPNNFSIWVRLDDELHCVSTFKKYCTGVYFTDLNPHTYLHSVYGYDNVREFNDVDFEVCFYGVADTPQQILEYPKHLNYFIKSKRHFVCCMTEIHKKDQPKRDGWRWHKWGSYIGNHQIMCEYLYDEIGINSVLLYHFYEILLEK